MGGRSYQIGNEFGQIWCNNNLGEIPGMDLHLRQRMKKIAPWLVRWRRGRERNPIPNLSPAKKARSPTCPEWSVFTITRMDIMPIIVQKRRRIIRLQDLQLVRLWLRNLSWNSHSSHEWCLVRWDQYGTWIVVHLSTWWETKSFSVACRRRNSRCISKWVMMGGTVLSGVVHLPEIAR